MTAPTPHSPEVPHRLATSAAPRRRTVGIGTDGLDVASLTRLGLPADIGPIAPGDVVWQADADDPLVADTGVDADGCGPLRGLRVRLHDVRALPRIGRPVLCVAGAVVATELTTDTGSVLLVGSAAPFRAADDHPGTAAFRAWAATGQLDGAASHPLRHAPHAPAPVIETSGADWAGLDAPPGIAASQPEFVRAAGHASRLLPAHVHDALVDFGDQPPPAGALVIRGIPVCAHGGELGPTPPRPGAPTDKSRRGDWRSEFVLLSVARRLGQPVGYLPEHGGDLIQQIVPTPGGADQQISTSSQVTLEFHTEAAFHRHRPRLLLLLCLRGDPAAATLLSSIREVAALLGPDVRAVLRERRFRTCADRSYVGATPTRLGAPMPVLCGPPEAPQLTFDADLMVGTDRAADDALCTLRAATQQCHTALTLRGGDLLVVDNTLAVHGRSVFAPRFDGTDRWLQRSFVVADLAASAAERDGRVVTTRYAP